MVKHVAFYLKSRPGLPEGHTIPAEVGPVEAPIHIYADGGKQRRRWKALLVKLDEVSCIVVQHAGDLPSRTVWDLLKMLTLLQHHGVGLRVGEIDTKAGGAGAVLDLMKVYRAAKLSQAIRTGQEKARSKGRKIGRPAVPPKVRQGIKAAIAAGDGVRATARRFGVAAATVYNIHRP